MKYKDIKCIDESWLNGKIEELELKYHNTPRNKHSAKSDSLLRRIELLEEIKQHLTFATPILEKAFEAGHKS